MKYVYNVFWLNQVRQTQKWQSKNCNTYGVFLLSSIRFRMQDTGTHVPFIMQFEVMMSIIVDKT
jgi:hypothetical protein